MAPGPLETTRPDFKFESHMRACWPQMRIGFVSSPKSPRGLKKAQIFSAIRYMSVITGLIWSVWYIEAIWWHSKLGLLPPLPIQYVDNFVNLIMQQSLLGRQASCVLLSCSSSSSSSSSSGSGGSSSSSRGGSRIWS